MNGKSLIKLSSGPVMGLLFFTLLKEFGHTDASVARMGFITGWVGTWWLTEVVNLAITAFIPFVLLPFLGILDAKEVASQYMDQVIFLFMGGFILAFAIEKWHLHNRFAKYILSITGNKPESILLGIMFTSFFISMWISNTATVMMLLSAVLAIIHRLDKFNTNTGKLTEALLIGLAYSATIGGMATLVGTPTNMIFYSYYQQHFPNDKSVTFFSWFMIGFPIAISLLFICYFILKKIFSLNKIEIPAELLHVEKEIEATQKLSYEEKAVALIFGITVFLWFFRSDIPLGNFTIPGWSNLFPYSSFIQDSTVAILMSTTLFFIPSKNLKGSTLLNFEDIKRLPFDIILLFGSGFALAKGFEVSGLSKWIAGQLGNFSNVHIWVLLLILCTLITVLSEFSSNVASIQLMLPVIMPLTEVLKINPLALIIPATLAASLGFMLPVATAPNTIVYGTARVKAKHMYLTGLFLNIAGIVLISIVILTLGKTIFKF